MDIVGSDWPLLVTSFSEAKNKLRELVGNPGLRREVRQRGFARAAPYSLENLVWRLLLALADVEMKNGKIGRGYWRRQGEWLLSGRERKIIAVLLQVAEYEMG